MTTFPRPDRRRFIAAAAAFTAAPSLVRAADATLDATLAEAAALTQLRAVAVWRDGPDGGREIAARGYHGFTPDRPTNI